MLQAAKGLNDVKSGANEVQRVGKSLVGDGMLDCQKWVDLRLAGG